MLIGFLNYTGTLKVTLIPSFNTALFSSVVSISRLFKAIAICMFKFSHVQSKIGIKIMKIGAIMGKYVASHKMYQEKNYLSSCSKHLFFYLMTFIKEMKAQGNC